MSLTSSRIGDGSRIKRGQTIWSNKAIICRSQEPAGRYRLVGIGRRRDRKVSMRRQFGDRKGVGLLAAFFAKGMPLADMDRHFCPKIGQREIHPSISPKSRAEQREERL